MANKFIKTHSTLGHENIYLSQNSTTHVLQCSNQTNTLSSTGEDAQQIGFSCENSCSQCKMLIILKIIWQFLIQSNMYPPMTQ
jgi:hypothetical protein